MKVEVNGLRQQLEIITFKQQIEEEDFKKSEKWMREMVEKQLQDHKEQKVESDNALYGMDAVKKEIDLIEKRSYLKKRYV